MEEKCDQEKRLSNLEEKVEAQESIIVKLVKDIMRFWHIAIGVGLGLVLEKFGLDKIISKLL